MHSLRIEISWKKKLRDPSDTLRKGPICFLLTAQEGHVDCLEWLAKYSGTAYWELPRDGMTAVHAAAVEGHLECLAFLLRSAGCRVFVRDRTGNTPLHYGMIVINSRNDWSTLVWRDGDLLALYSAYFGYLVEMLFYCSGGEINVSWIYGETQSKCLNLS